MQSQILLSVRVNVETAANPICGNGEEKAIRPLSAAVVASNDQSSNMATKSKTKTNKTKAHGFRASRKSDTFKYGEGDPHLKAKMRVVEILRSWINKSGHYLASASLVQPEVSLSASYELFYVDESRGQKAILLPELINPRTPAMGRKRFFHPFDICVKLVHLNKLVEWILIEIDGKWHEKKRTQQRDREVERIQAQLIPDARLVRIPISEAKHAPEKDLIDLVFWSVFAQRR